MPFFPFSIRKLWYQIPWKGISKLLHHMTKHFPWKGISFWAAFLQDSQKKTHVNPFFIKIWARKSHKGGMKPEDYFRITMKVRMTILPSKRRQDFLTFFDKNFVKATKKYLLYSISCSLSGRLWILQPAVVILSHNYSVNLTKILHFFLKISSNQSRSGSMYVQNFFRKNVDLTKKSLIFPKK